MNSPDNEETPERSLEDYLDDPDTGEIPEDELRGIDLPDSLGLPDTRGGLGEPLEPIHMRVVGAWGGSALLADPKLWVGFAKKIRLNRLDLMINDHSAARRCEPFKAASVAKIAKIAEYCRHCEIELHLTSWIMPCRKFIESAAEFLLPVMQDHGIASLVWDAEEPWTLNTDGMSAIAAAKLVGELFPQERLGVTGITYLNGPKLKPLIRRAATLIPQAYATINSSFSSSEIVYRARTMWHKRTGKVPTVMGLAGYRQGDAPESRMLAALAAVADCEIDTVCYWSLANIRKNPAIARFVETIRG